MNTDTGQFVPDRDATPDMNRYQIGKVVEIEGDSFVVTYIDNERGRGRVVLRALSAADRERDVLDVLREIVSQESGPTDSRNRHERRRSAALRRKGKNR